MSNQGFLIGYDFGGKDVTMISMVQGSEVVMAIAIESSDPRVRERQIIRFLRQLHVKGLRRRRHMRRYLRGLCKRQGVQFNRKHWLVRKCL